MSATIDFDTAESYAEVALGLAVRDYLTHRGTDACYRTNPAWWDPDRRCYQCDTLDRTHAQHERLHDYGRGGHHVRRWQAMEILDRYSAERTAA